MSNEMKIDTATVVFVKSIPGLGIFELRPLDLDADIPEIHQWVNQSYAVYWGMNGFSKDEVHAAYEKILLHTEVYIGFHNGKLSFLMESYNPQKDVIGDYYTVEHGDRGMHILVAPPTIALKGFTWAVFTLILDFIFSDASVNRIVVEPDARNHKIHILNEKAGFKFQQFIELPHKKARLEFCTRTDYYQALQKMES
jgi:RimJ/RimL family protein N-acetyltransferase